MIRRSGFTLVEILVVLAMLALVSAFSFKALPRFASRLYLNGAARTVASELRAVQSRAMLRHEKQSYDFRRSKLPAGLKFSRTRPIGFAASGGTPPGGSGTLVLEDRFSRRQKIIVSSAGRVRLE